MLIPLRFSWSHWCTLLWSDSPLLMYVSHSPSGAGGIFTRATRLAGALCTLGSSTSTEDGPGSTPSSPASPAEGSPWGSGSTSR